MPSRFISVVKFRPSEPVWRGGDLRILSFWPSGAYLLIIYFMKSVANAGRFSLGGEGDFLILAFLRINRPLVGDILVGFGSLSGDLLFFLMIFITLLFSEIFLLFWSFFAFGFKLTKFAFKILRFWFWSSLLLVRGGETSGLASGLFLLLTNLILLRGKVYFWTGTFTLFLSIEFDRLRLTSHFSLWKLLGEVLLFITFIFFFGITSAPSLSGLIRTLKFRGEVLTFCICGDLFTLVFGIIICFLSVF